MMNKDKFKITIIGYKGNLGSVLLKFFPDSYCVDIDNQEELNKYLKISDYAFLALPINEEKNIIKNNLNFNGFIDLSSVKNEMLEFKNRIISIHPLFGPLSYKENKDIIFINDISYDNSIYIIKKLFKGYNIITMSSEEHDVLMSEIMVKPYILSYISDSLNSKIKTNSYIKFLCLYNIKNNETIENMLNTIILNKNSYKIIEDMENKLNVLKKSIKYR